MSSRFVRASASATAGNPLEDGTLSEYRVSAVPLTSMTVEALKDIDIAKKEAERAKNMFALGLLSWMYNRPTESTLEFLERKFAKLPTVAKANVTAFRAGYNFGETTETFSVSYEIKPAPMKAGTYRNISGNLALSYGLVAASQGDRVVAVPWAPTRSRRRPTSCMNCPSTRRSACGRSKPKTRSPG